MIRLLATVLLATMLAACGGGGGSPGTVSGGSGGGGTGGGGTGGTGGTGSTPPAATPTVALQLRDAANNVVNSITTSPIVYAKASVTTAAGAPAAGQVVTFTGDASLVKFLPLSGTALTDSTGVAIIQVLPASGTAAGAGVMSAASTVGGVATTSSPVSFQVPVVAANNGLPTLSLGLRNASNASTNIVSGTSTTTARAVLLDASGQPLAGTVVAFSGDTSLLKFSPAAGTVLTDSNGVASIQVSPASAASAGAGTVKASANVAGTTIAQTFDYQLAAVASAGVPTITVALRDASGSPTNSLSASGVTTARAVLLDASGNAIVGKVVTFAADATLVKMNPASGQVLTDSTGTASVQLTPASLSAAGASTITGSATVAGSVLSNSFDYQLSAANLALQNLNLGSGAVPAYGNRAVSVGVTINGVPATATPVQVTFSATCGSLTPATVTTDGTGTASTTYKADSATCAGSNVTVSATAVSAPPLSGTIAVAASLATNVQFTAATPQLIYLVGSVGATQSQVGFKVVDSSGNPLQNQQLQLSIVNSAPGVSLNTVGNTAPVTLTTDAAGLVSVAVFSGTVPTSVQVRAVLVGNTTVGATSNVLTVASGRPVQRAMSTSLERFSIEGLNVDGATSRVTVSLADRQGNPVPDGTQVNFTTKYGLMIPASCIVAGGTSSCSVDIRSQGDRSAPFLGRVAILAYVPGEEDFIDLNGNNVYDPGEPFTDLGNAFRDEYTSTVNGVPGLTNGLFDPGEFVVPRAGSTACAGGVNGVPNTCDGVWGTADVRVETEVIFASSQAYFDAPDLSVPGQIKVNVYDVNHNSMPTGSTITAEKLSPGGDTCAVKKTLPSSIPNTYGPTELVLVLDSCGTGDVIGITVTTPGLAAAPTSTFLSVRLP